MLTYITNTHYFYVLFVSLSLANLGAIGQVTSPAQNTIRNQDTLAVYVGEYVVSPNFVLIVKVVNNELTVTPPKQKTVPIIRISGDVFAIKDDNNIQMKFVRNNNESIEKVILNQNGEKIEARRIESVKRFNPDKMYSAEQLKSDLGALKAILSEHHPRPYEFTSEKAFQHSYDSLLASINQPMNEISFRYRLMPLVAKIHCGHTKLDPSIQFQQSKPNDFPPFVLYYEGKRAFVRYSANKDLPVGAEVTSINRIPIAQRIQNLLARTSGDGIHLNVQYYLINQPMSWFLYEMPYWYNIEKYNLTLSDSAGHQRTLQLTSIDEASFREHIPPPTPKRHQLNVLENKKIAILNYPSLDFPDTNMRNRFLEETFTKLRTEGINRLIIDLRGNAGGSPHNSAFFLKYLIPQEFRYSNIAPLSELADLKTPITPVENCFEGKIYVLIDGGCFSSTGHLLSLLRYYKIGTFIGETTSASYSCNTNGVPYALPHTGLRLFCPKYVYETAVNGFRRADGISPDYEVKESFKDVLSAKDAMLEYTISIAEKETR